MGAVLIFSAMLMAVCFVSFVVVLGANSSVRDRESSCPPALSECPDATGTTGHAEYGGDL